MARIEIELKSQIISVKNDVEKLDLSYNTDENVKWYNIFGKQSDSSSND